MTPYLSKAFVININHYLEFNRFFFFLPSLYSHHYLQHPHIFVNFLHPSALVDAKRTSAVAMSTRDAV